MTAKITSEGLNTDSVTLLAGMFGVEYGMYVPSVLAALGACAGFASQMAVWKELIEATNRNPGDFFEKTIISQTNQVVYLGDAPIRFLTATIPDRLSFLSLAGISVGTQVKIPDLDELASHNLKSLGTSAFGHPRLPADIKVHEPPFLCLLRTWGKIKWKFETERRPYREWPMLFGAMAYRLILKHHENIGQEVCLRIMLESAYPTLWIDPSSIPQAEFKPPSPEYWSHRAKDLSASQEITHEVFEVMPTELTY